MAPNAKRPIQPDDLYLLKTVSDPRVSPDGNQVAYVVGASELEADEVFTSIWVASLDNPGSARRFTFGTKDTSWEREWIHFYDRILSGKGRLCGDALDGLRANEIVEAVYRSSDEHMEIQLPRG